MTVLLALAAAVCFAAAVVMQQQAAVAHGARPSLVLQPLWLLGGVIDFAGFVLQIVAVHLGGVIATQVLLTAVLPLGLVFGRVRLGRSAWLGVLAMAVGLSGVLLAADPRVGRGHPDAGPLAVVITAVVAAAVVIGPRRSQLWEARGQAAAAALLFALSATLAHAFGDELTQGGVGRVLTHAPVYLLAVAASIGLAVEQQAFAAGPLATNLVILTLLDPLASVGLGVAVAGDRLRGGAYTVAAVAAGAIAAGGVVLLSKAQAQAAEHGAPHCGDHGGAGGGTDRGKAGGKDGGKDRGKDGGDHNDHSPAAAGPSAA